MFSQIRFNSWQHGNYFLVAFCFENENFSKWVDFRAVYVEARNDTKSAFAADEELLEVVAGVVLHYLGPHVEHFPAWQHRLDPQNV